MYWEESTTNDKHSIPDNILDVVFGISCRALPVDHAYELSRAIIKELPWIDDEPNVGIHTIHVAASGNGWIRPDDANELLYPSRRTKLTLRIPKARLENVQSLIGKTIDVAGNALTINNMTPKSLSEITTIFARYIVAEGATDEMEFMQQILVALKALDIQPKKMLPGKETQLASDSGTLITRSLMIADLKLEQSLRLQQIGVGSHRWMGCGLFLPHKHINEIGETMG